MVKPETALIGGIFANLDRLAEVRQVLPNSRYLSNNRCKATYYFLCKMQDENKLDTSNAYLIISDLYMYMTSPNPKTGKSYSTFLNEYEFKQYVSDCISNWNGLRPDELSKDYSDFAMTNGNPAKLIWLAQFVKWYGHDAGNIYRYAQHVMETVYTTPFSERDRYVSKIQSDFGNVAIDIRESNDLLRLSETTAGIEAEFAKMKNWEVIDNSIQTGLGEFDRYLGNMNPGEVIVVAATPGSGKTAISMTIAANVAMGIGNGGKKHSVMIFSLEMMETQLLYRMIARAARLNTEAMLYDYRKIVSDRSIPELKNTPELNERQERYKARLDRAHIGLDFVKTLPIYQDTASNMNVNIMQSLIAQKKEEIAKNGEYPLGLIIIDYLQIMSPVDTTANMSRNDIVGQMSRKIKQIAKEAQVPVLLLSQLNRQANTDQKPSLSNLRESGSIEQDADKVVFLYCESANKEERDYLQESDDERVRKLMKQRDQMHIKIAIAKNRQGQTGEVDAIFDKQFQNFVTQSVEKARTEKFDEFFAKYYSNTRSGRDLYWPMRQDDVPTTLQPFRNAGIVENDYIADGKFIPRDSGHSSSQRMQLRQQYDFVPLEAYDGYAMDNGNVFSSVCDDDASERTESKANRIIDDAIHGGDTTKHDDKHVTATDSGNGAQPAADARQRRSEARTDASVDDGYWFTDDDADGYEDAYDEPMTDEDIDAAFAGDDELPPWAGGSGSTDDMADAMSSDDAVDDDDDEISRLLNDAGSMLSAMGVDNVDDDDLDIDLDELDVFNS